MLPVDIVIILTALLIVWLSLTTIYAFIGGVPYIPTPKYVARAMIDLAPISGSQNVFDLGAGDGRVLIEAKHGHPAITATGIELAPMAWLIGRLTIGLSGERVTLLRGNAFKTDLHSADVIFLYLSPRLMAALEEKFDRELKPGTIVISHAFSFPRRQPLETKTLPGRRPVVLRKYVW